MKAFGVGCLLARFLSPSGRASRSSLESHATTVLSRYRDAAMTWDIMSGAGVTALGLAAARSVESSRPDRLMTDPFARPLFEAANANLPMLAEWPNPSTPVSDAEALHLHRSRYIGLRTRFYDDVLLAAIRDGAGQGVLVGAGLDARAYRLTFPAGFRLFEIDQPGVLEFKEIALAGLGRRTALRPVSDRNRSASRLAG